MTIVADTFQWIIGALLLLFSLGVVFLRNPVYASLSFLVTLLMLAALYLELSAEFIAVMQVLVYVGAIMVIFMFVIILFQDAHQQIAQFKPVSSPVLAAAAAFALLTAFVFISPRLKGMGSADSAAPEGFGSVETLGRALYLDFFFPFEAVILLFLVAVVGALYIGRKGK